MTTGHGTPAPPPLDVVGDVHGQLDALVALGRELGYDVDGDWGHPEARTLVFVGDLVDRGEHSLEVAELVRALVARRRAVCLMGNHEYNLVAWRRGLATPKRSNRPTIADIERRPDRWDPLLDWFATLPIALELPGLRIVHAVWHLHHLGRVAPLLAPPPRATNGHAADPIELLERAVALRSPFDGAGLVPGLPMEHVAPGNDTPFEILLKGFEEPSTEPFLDAEGQPRYLVRVAWWRTPGPEIPADGRIVFGHYWNVPPTRGRAREATPPHPSGHPALRRWTERHAPRVPPRGAVKLARQTRFVCVDYNGVPRVGAGLCVGAYRHPEHEVRWVRLPIPPGTPPLPSIHP